MKDKPRLEEVHDSSVPTGEQTTIRIRKRLQKELSVIATFEDKTIFSVTDSILTDYKQRYEAAIGRPLLPPERKEKS